MVIRCKSCILLQRGCFQKCEARRQEQIHTPSLTLSVIMPLRHAMHLVFHLLTGALISNGTVVSSLADKQRHIGGRGLPCQPISRECQLTNVLQATSVLQADLRLPLLVCCSQSKHQAWKSGFGSTRKSSCAD